MLTDGQVRVLRRKLMEGKTQEAARRDLRVLSLQSGGMTAREIADRIGVSHTTVLRSIRRMEEEQHGGA